VATECVDAGGWLIVSTQLTTVVSYGDKNTTKKCFLFTHHPSYMVHQLVPVHFGAYQT
jgi:hypothetical protein